MLLVPITVAPAAYGYGAFAAVDIPAGVVLWRDGGPDDPTVVRLTHANALAAEAAGVPVRRWATQDLDGTWLLAVDGSQFFNHHPDDAPDANTATCWSCGCVYSTRPIPAGTELRCDYRVDDAAAAEKLPAELSAGHPGIPALACPQCPPARSTVTPATRPDAATPALRTNRDDPGR